MLEAPLSRYGESSPTRQAGSRTRATVSWRLQRGIAAVEVPLLSRLISSLAGCISAPNFAGPTGPLLFIVIRHLRKSEAFKLYYGFSAVFVHGLVVKDDIQKGAVDVQIAVVVNKTEPPKLIQKETDTRSRRPHHFG